MRTSFRATFVLVAALAPLMLGVDSCQFASTDSGARLGDVCGGLDSGPCAAGLYCDFSLDAGTANASGAGRCAEVSDPTACALIYDPVCGLDGRTYGNACLAAAGGATVVAQGECQPDVIGCIALYDPVCGTDGRTYGNSCEAAAAGVAVASAGECAGGACPDPAPLAPNILCPDGTIGGPVCACDAAGCHWELRSCPTLTVCGGFAGFGCDRGEFCDYAVGDLCGAADQTGVCRSIPTFCTFEYAPVCGCDGNTYSNACMAAGNGVSVASLGACGGSTTACSPADCGPAPASPFPVECVQDPATGSCSWQQACPIPECAAPPPGCHYEGYTACGCGTLVCDTTGGTSCGGFAGFTCAPGEFCNYAAGDYCGAADQTGVCTVIPDACDTSYDPVCGCDGKTYSNACQAAANAMSVQTLGACGGTTTCDPASCGPAPLSPLPYECLPDANGTCTWQPSCLPPPCAAPPPGCRYDGGTTCTCGTLVCDQCALVDCLPPDPTCGTIPDGTCCGITVCQ